MENKKITNNPNILVQTIANSTGCQAVLIKNKGGKYAGIGHYFMPKNDTIRLLRICIKASNLMISNVRSLVLETQGEVLVKIHEWLCSKIVDIDEFIVKQFYQIISQTINKSLSNCVEREKIESCNCRNKLYFLRKMIVTPMFSFVDTAFQTWKIDSQMDDYGKKDEEKKTNTDTNIDTNWNRKEYFILCDCIDLQGIVNNLVELYQIMMQWRDKSNDTNIDAIKDDTSVQIGTNMNCKNDYDELDSNYSVSTESNEELERDECPLFSKSFCRQLTDFFGLFGAIMNDSVLHNKASFVDSFYSIITDLSLDALKRCLQVVVDYDFDTYLEELDEYEQNVLKNCCELVCDITNILQSISSRDRPLISYKSNNIARISSTKGIILFKLTIRAVKARFMNVKIRRALLKWCCAVPMNMNMYWDDDQSECYEYWKRLALSTVMSLYSNNNISDIETARDFIHALFPGWGLQTGLESMMSKYSDLISNQTQYVCTNILMFRNFTICLNFIWFNWFWFLVFCVYDIVVTFYNLILM